MKKKLEKKGEQKTKTVPVDIPNNSVDYASQAASVCSIKEVKDASIRFPARCRDCAGSHRDGAVWNISAHSLALD